MKIIGKNIDIIFLSYQEKECEQNFERVKARYPRVKRLHQIKGLARAHYLTSLMADTEFYFLLDGDNVTIDEFDIDAIECDIEAGSVYIWDARNPVNDLEYAYGGLKLCCTESMKKLDTKLVDVFSSASLKLKAVHTVATITRFNVDPFSTWLAGFREGVTLSSRSEFTHLAPEIKEARLLAWKTKGHDREFGEWAIKGALEGERFAQEFKVQKEILQRVNDYHWMREYFNEHHGQH